MSGETSAGARRRIDWLLREPAAVLVIETGANDGLRGLDVDSLAGQHPGDRRPRAAAIAPAADHPGRDGSAAESRVRATSRRFQAVYPALARQNGLPLVPFLLEGVAGVDSLNQADGIHPTAAGQRQVAETVWPTLEPVLRGTG